MALDTYTDLLAELATFSVRDDQTALWPTCVRLAEAWLNRELKLRRMEAHEPVTIDAEYEAVPADFGGVRAFELQTNPVVELQYRKPDDMAALKGGDYQAGGIPQVYTIVGDEFRFLPAPDESYTAELTYWQKIPALASNETNWLLSDHPDLYLYGALVQFAMMTEDQRLGAWSGVFNEAIRAARAADSGERYGAKLSMKIRRMG